MGFFDLIPWQVCVYLVLTVFAMAWFTAKIGPKSNSNWLPWVFLLWFVAICYGMAYMMVWTSPSFSDPVLPSVERRAEARGKCLKDDACKEMIYKFYGVK